MTKPYIRSGEFNDEVKAINVGRFVNRYEIEEREAEKELTQYKVDIKNNSVMPVFIREDKVR